MKPKIVTPDAATGYDFSLLMVFGKGPKWTITCGNCHLTFQERLPMIDYPCLPCPFCNVVNKIPVTVSRG